MRAPFLLRLRLSVYLATLALLLGCGSTSDGTRGQTASGGQTTVGGSGGAISSGGTMSSGSMTSTSTGGIATGGMMTTGGGTGGRLMTGGGGASGVIMTGSGGMAGNPTGGGPGMGGGSGATAGGSGGGGAANGGAAGSGTGGSGGSANPPMGENSVAYIGCSMAWNIGTGYKRVGGKVMWNSDSYQTSAMVVQNWTDTNSASWRLFDQKMSSIGGKDKVKAIMVQICIFSSRATDVELKNMIASARKHVNAGTHVYIVGQPQYEAGHECQLAGTGGAKWTDDQAKALAADSSVNQDMTYLGQFKLDSTMNEVMNDTCHATSPTGENKLGDQAKVFFGG